MTPPVPDPGPSPAFEFGVIADIQYADTPDGTNFAKTTKRHFRGALEVLRKAVAYWNELPLSFVADLGDAIDGRCVRLGQTESALDSVLSEFSRCRCETLLHLVGNHDLYNFPERAELARRLDTRGAAGLEYYSFSPAPAFRVLVLDSYHVSLLAPPGDPNRELAQKILRVHNPNDVETSGDNWFDGMAGVERRFVPYNGALGDTQLDWLHAELQAARCHDERALLLTHAPLHPDACDGTTMAWDYDRVLEALDAAPGTVAAVIAGHDHKGGYALDRGVHHLTLKSPLNLGRAGECYGRVAFYDDRLEIRCPAMSDLLDSRLADGRLAGRDPARDDPAVKLAFR